MTNWSDKNEGSGNQKKSKKELDQFAFDMVDMIESPIVVGSGSWASIIPKDLHERIKIERIAAQASKEKKATISEVVAYLMPASLEQPFSHEWVNIYTWCAAQYVKKYKGLDMSDIAPEKLSRDEERKLDQLRTFIYEKRRGHTQNRLRKLKHNQSRGKDKGNEPER